MTRQMRSGAVGLHEAASRLIDYGYEVYLPAVDTGCDLVCEVNGVAVRCQVKATRCKREGPSSHFDLRRTGTKRNKPYSPDRIDVYVLLHLRSQEAYVVPADSLGGRLSKIRLRPDSPYRDAWHLIAHVAVRFPRTGSATQK